MGGAFEEDVLDEVRQSELTGRGFVACAAVKHEAAIADGRCLMAIDDAEAAGQCGGVVFGRSSSEICHFDIVFWV